MYAIQHFYVYGGRCSRHRNGSYVIGTRPQRRLLGVFQGVLRKWRLERLRQMAFRLAKYYTPDYYKIGYLTVAGMGLGPHGEFFDNTLRPRFHGFAREMQQDWQEDTRSRAPFQPYSELTKDESFYVSYSGLVPFEGKIYAVKAGLADNARIVSLDPATGKVRKSRLTSADSSLLPAMGSCTGPRRFLTCAGRCSPHRHCARSRARPSALK